MKQTLIEGTDTKLSKTCDELLAIRKESAVLRERSEQAEKDLIELLNSMNKQTIKHEGHVFSIKHKEASESISIKEES